MAFCTFSNEAAMYDVTPVENIFLLEYMPTAPERCLKVYLYLRMVCLHPDFGCELRDIARALNTDEAAVEEALDYWTARGLLEKRSDRPATYALLPLHAPERDGFDDMNRDYYAYRDFNADLQSLFGPDELLHGKQYQLAHAMMDDLGFRTDAALWIIGNELKTGRAKKPEAVFKNAYKHAEEWAQAGLRSVEELKNAAGRNGEVKKLAERVLARLSISRKPTEDELAVVLRWTEEWKLSAEDIIDACAKTTGARTPSVAYLDGILRREREDAGEENFADLKAALAALGQTGVVPTDDLKTRYACLLKLGFEKPTVLLAAQQCAAKGLYAFEDLEWMLDKWAKEELFAPEKAQAYLEDRRAALSKLRELWEIADVRRRPKEQDLARYDAWRDLHSEEMLRFAAETARGKQDPPSYMDKLLSAWAERGVASPEAARASRGQAEAPGKKFNYAQHSYEKSELDDPFFNALREDLGEDTK